MNCPVCKREVQTTSNMCAQCLLEYEQILEEESQEEKLFIGSGEDVILCSEN